MIDDVLAARRRRRAIVVGLRAVAVNLNIERAVEEDVVFEHESHVLDVPSIGAAMIQLDQGDVVAWNGKVVAFVNIVTHEFVEIPALKIVTEIAQIARIARSGVAICNVDVDVAERAHSIIDAVSRLRPYFLENFAEADSRLLRLRR